MINLLSVQHGEKTKRVCFLSASLLLVSEAVLTLKLASFLELVCKLLLFMSVFFLAGD